MYVSGSFLFVFIETLVAEKRKKKKYISKHKTARWNVAFAETRNRDAR